MKKMEDKMTVLKSLSEERETRQRFKVLAVMAVLVMVCVTGAFAAESIAVLDNAGQKIISIIGSTWVKALLAVALVIEFGVIAFGNAQGQGDIIKKVLPWVIGTAGILGATSIVNFFFSNVSTEKLSMVVQTALAAA